MQFIDLHAQQKRIRDEIENRIRKVLDHGRYIMGPEVTELEKTLGEYVGVPYALGVASGTDALLIALMASGVGPGDAVFTTPFTFISTAEVIQLLGATPVFVDIEPDTFNIDPQRLEAAVEETLRDGGCKPRGIIPVDLFGQPADYDAIEALGRRHNLFVLEDAAQSFGASFRRRQACGFGDMAATSFFPAKPLGAYGDGGMIFTDDEALFERMRSIRNHGSGGDKYTNIRVGINGRLDTLQAAVLLAKFTIFEDEIARRQQIAQRYTDGLKDLLETPVVRDGNVSAWAQYSLRHAERDAIIGHLKEKDIPTAIYYPIPLHLQKAFAGLGCRQDEYPVSERAAREIFSIPMHPYLEPRVQDTIIQAIRAAIS